MAENNRLREITIEAVRGDVFDRNGKLLVTSRPSISITAIPYIIEKYPDVYKKFIKLIGITSKEMKKRLKESGEDPLKPKIIVRDAKQELIFYIKEHGNDFPGIKVEELPVRHYPNGQMAAHLLGYVGEVSDEQLAKETFKDVKLGDLVGKDGIEYQYNSTLMGIKGKQIIETNSKGRPTRSVKTTKPVPGNSIVLTIDEEIQKATEDALDKAVKASRTQYDKNFKKHYLGTAGAAVVLNPKNGQIIAMASSPSYDPRLFIGGITEKQWKGLNSKEAHAPMNNRAYTSLYPPASTFKPFTAFAALQESIINTSTPFNCKGAWRAWNQTFKCWSQKGHGTSSIVRALTVSCDVFFYNTGALLYRNKKHDGESLQYWARKFGFGKKTGIPMPNEGGTRDINQTAGRVPTKKWKAAFNRMNDRKFQIWYPGDTINMSIGQGDLLVTPLQLANAYSAIANGGTLYKPQILKDIVSPHGKSKKLFKKETNSKVKIKPQALAAIRQGLRSVVGGEGTASGAFSGLPVKVAGKTGTAQMKGKQDTALFVGYAPYDNPKYVVAVIVEEGGHGGSVAAPAARAIFSAIFNKGKSKFKVIKGVAD